MAAPKGGIYKITSPSGKVYIGQAVDFDVRIARYKTLKCEGQRRLYASFKKYGYEAHVVELIDNCDGVDFNERERYWQEYYDVLGLMGLNCRLQQTDTKKYRHSEETKRLIAASHIGQKHTEEWKKAQSERKKNMSEETKEKIRLANLGKKTSETTRQKHAERMKGNCYTRGMLTHNAVRVVNIDDGTIYPSISSAAMLMGLKRSTLQAMLVGKIKNKTTLKLVA